MRILVAAAIVSMIATAPPVLAQERSEPRDSLEAEVRRLKERLDSLEQMLERLLAEGRDTAQMQDELAALRAAARAAAGAGAAADTTPTQTSRTRSLQRLNPEISVTGDIVGTYANAAGESGNATAVPREFEFSFQSALDPYTHTKIFVTREQDFEIAGLPEEADEEGRGGFEIEEGYLYWVGLPGRIGLKAGKFRQEIGLYNRWHTHALHQADRPLAAVTFLGEDGLIQTGVSLASPAVSLGPATQTLTFELTAGTNDALFGDGTEPSFLGRFQSFWDVGRNSYVQLGATGVLGEDDDASLEARLLGLDAAFRWAPARGAVYREFQLKGEWYFAEQDVGGAVETGHGGYGQVNLRLDRRWIVGARADFLDGYGAGPTIVQIVPSITWWQSEWVRVRLQYNYVRVEGGSGNHTLLAQVVWAMGPHKHETY
jgi:hypothetical protein